MSAPAKRSSSSSGEKKKGPHQKDAAADGVGGDQSLPIYTKSHDEQVDLLAQALLREYMHKKGYKQSLASFDEECPRNGDTVSSRKVMGDLMLLSADKQKGIKELGLETIMEMLCYDRVSKKDQLTKMSSLQGTLSEEIPPLFVAPPIPEKEKKPKKDKEKKEKTKEKKKKKKSSEDGDTPTKKEKKNKKKSKEGTKQQKAVAPDGSTFSIDDLLDKEIPSFQPTNNQQQPQEYPSLKKKNSDTKKKVVILGVEDESKRSPPPPPPPSSSASSSSAANAEGKSRRPPSTTTSSADEEAAAARAFGGDGSDDDSSSDDASSASSSSQASSSGGDNSSDDGEDYAASLKRLRAEQEESLKKQHLKREGGRAVASWNVEDNADVGNASNKAPSSSSKGTANANTQPSASSSSSSAGPSATHHHHHHHHPSPLGPSVANTLLSALVGGGSQGAFRKIPNSFMRQGFHFNDSAEEDEDGGDDRAKARRFGGGCEALRYGLLQNEGGPCGILAAVQARLLQHFMGNFFIVTTDIQRTFLVRSLADSLIAAQPDVGRIVIATVHDGPSTPSTWPATGSGIVEQKAFLADCVGRGGFGFKSRQALEEYLSTLVGCVDDTHERKMNGGKPSDWCRLRGYGVLCFILSLLLSRGAEVVLKDMDVQQPMIVEHGYCSQEVTNLVMAGAATSNVHDGVKKADGVELKGILKESMPIGHLSFLETRGLLTVGQRLKRPQFPIWVIYHESHYTCLFMKKDLRDAVEKAYVAEGGGGGSTSLDVFFYDQQGGQDEEIRLTVTLDHMPLPPQRKDALVPYLNVIIRTIGDQWENARVSWNGTDPLL